jgi:hypothetical protein
VYRNYSEGPDPLLEASPWVSDPSDLQSFMSRIISRGGCGNEAVEIGLWHANQMHEQLEADGERLNQVVLIGDMPPNTPYEVTRNRSGFDWSQTDYATETNVDMEVHKLVDNEIPVHGFCVNGYVRTKEAFSAISRATNEENPICQDLDVQPGGGGANRLAEVITKSIFDSFSGRLDRAVINNMKNAYDTKFGYMK